MAKRDDDEMMEQYEETALLGMKHVRAYLLYEGDNSKYLQKAKVGAMVMGSYTRLRATKANERALALAARRQLKGEGNDSGVRALSAAV